jgi:hypothetical protein
MVIRSRKRVGKSKVASKVKLPLDTYEEWLKRQAVKLAAKKHEVKVPLDSYEEWIRIQIKKHLE